MDRHLKKRIADWKSKIGRDEALLRLRETGLSLSMIQKILGGSYPHQPIAPLVNLIEMAMAKK